MTYSTTMTSKGQITLPAAFREKLGLVPGKKVTVELRGDKIVVNAPVDVDVVRSAIRKHMQTHHPKPITQAEIDRVKTEDLRQKYLNGVGK